MAKSLVSCFLTHGVEIHFEIKYSEAILSNSTRKLLRFEIAKMLVAVLRNEFIVSVIITWVAR